MLRGIQSAASAMSLSMQKMNLFAQNLSNSQTTGYKKKTYSIHSFEDMMVELPDVMNVRRYQEKMPVSPGSYIDNAGIKAQQGRLRQTGNALDVAIMGEKLYFQLEQKPQIDPKTGQQLNPNDKTYTMSRDGGFMIDKDGYLINHQGDFVLNTVDNQRIRLTADPDVAKLPPNANRKDQLLDASRIRIDDKGFIFDTAAPVGSAERARIKIVKWTENGELPMSFQIDPNAPTETPATEMQRILKKYGLALPDDQDLITQSMDLEGNARSMIEQEGARKGLHKIMLPGQPVAMEGSLKQGYLEGSNVDITQEMIMLMMTSKDYDMSQKLIGAEDKVLDKTINEMGRLQ